MSASDDVELQKPQEEHEEAPMHSPGHPERPYEDMAHIRWDDFGRTGILEEAGAVETSCFGCCSSFASPPRIPAFLPVSADEDAGAPRVDVRRVLVVVNPFGGNGRGRSAWLRVQQVLESAEPAVAYELVQTTHAGHATEVAQTYDLSQFDAFVVVGGDGTIHEVVQGLMARGDEQAASTPLGLIPGGTGNSVLVSCGETDPAEAARAIVNGYVRKMDMAKVVCDEGVFWSINIVAWGLGADANETAESCRCCGQMRYDMGALVHICKNAHRLALFEFDEEFVWEDDWAVGMVQNNQHSGVELRIAPFAKLDDGLLDFVFFRRASICTTLGKFDLVKKNGAHVYAPGVEYVRFKKLRIDTREKHLVNVDGENCASTPVEIEVVPGSLTVFFDPNKNRPAQ